MAYDYSADIAKQVEAFLVDDDWHYSPITENGVIRTGINLDCKLKDTQVYILIKRDGIVVYSHVSLKADDKTLDQAVKFVNRANYGLSYGNFEIDPDDGDIRYKSDLYCGDTIPSFDEIKHTIILGAIMLERYGDPLAKLLFGYCTAEEAVEEAENKS